jgi:putative transposase
MARGKRNQPEQVVNLRRQIEVAVANGKTTAQACKEAEIVEQTYFRWRREYGGLQIDQAKRLKELEQENGKLKRLVANLSLDNLVLEDIASGNVWVRPVFASAGLLLTHSGLRKCVRPFASRPLLATRPPPMARNGAVFNLSRPFPDRDGIDDLTSGLAVSPGVQGAAYQPLGPQVLNKLFFSTLPVPG